MASERLALDWGVARGVGAFRAVTLAWAATGLVLQRADLVRTPLAVAGLLVALAVTAMATVGVARRDGRVFARGFVALELAVGVGLLVMDGLVFDATRQQSLP
jgi:hypothetical protein